MVQEDEWGAPDRIVLRLEPGGPVELTGLTDSFAALARFYERHYRDDGDPATAPKLFVTKLETGSIIAEIAPYAVILGQAYSAVGGAVNVADFTKRLSDGLRAFAGMTPSALPAQPPSREDTKDLQAFIKPLTGRNAAELKIRHARFESRDGDRETIAEYTFDERELNRAAINIEKALALPEPEPAPPERSGIKSEVMLFFQQASREAGRQQGRTGDKAVVPDVTQKALPVYFRSGVNDLKEQMVRGSENPLAQAAFIVDVHVQYLGSEPKAYIVTEVHRSIQLDD